jgi:phytoene/squalene synthetase
MISKRKAIETIDMALEAYRDGAKNALDRLKKRELNSAQLRWLARRCATDVKRIDRLWRGFREYLTDDDAESCEEWQDLLRFRR